MKLSKMDGRTSKGPGLQSWMGWKEKSDRQGISRGISLSHPYGRALQNEYNICKLEPSTI
jgi:hypothetical protein